MNWKRVGLVLVVGLVVIVAAVGIGLSLYADNLYQDSYESEYSYSVSVAANESLEDLTVYVPVPVEDDDVQVIGTNVTVRESDETRPADAPPVTASIVETQYGPMLAIRAEAYPIEPRYYEFVEEDGEGQRVEIDESAYDPTNSDMVAFTERAVRVEITVDTDRSIDTQSPTGTEPLLAPEFARQSAPCEDTHFDTSQCYTVDSRAFLSYQAPAETRTTLWVELEGRNNWWIFGWNGNAYSERFIGEFDGPQDGWIELTGDLQTGWGNYRGDPPE